MLPAPGIGFGPQGEGDVRCHLQPVAEPGMAQRRGWSGRGVRERGVARCRLGRQGTAHGAAVGLEPDRERSFAYEI